MPRVHLSTCSRRCEVEEHYPTRAWSECEVPMRAPPLPAMVAIALAWYFVQCKELGGALLILLCFHGYISHG